MSSSFLLLLVAAILVFARAFVPTTPRLAVDRCHGSTSKLSMGYVPDGLTKEEYEKIKKEEAEKLKNLGAVGPNRFKSRSFAEWQAAGGKHLFPVDPRKVKSGEIPIEDVPYMQRKGAWDNSDLIGNKNVKDKSKLKVKKTKGDIEYEKGGFRKEQSVSIFGGRSMPWTQSYQAMDVDLALGKKYKGPRGKIEGGVSKKELEEMRAKIREENEKGFFGKLFGK